MMKIDERAAAITRSKRALKALADHPDTSQRQLGVARERLNDCLRLGDTDTVWAAVRDIEAKVAAVYGVPQDDEPAPRRAVRWISPRDRGRPSKPRRPRQPPRGEPRRTALFLLSIAASKVRSSEAPCGQHTQTIG